MSENMPGGDTNEKNAQVEARRKEERSRKLRSFRRLVRQPEFQQFYWDLLSETGMFKASFNLNTKLEDFQEGRRDVGLYLLKLLNEADPNMFPKMQRDSVSAALSRPQKEDTSNE